jgi:hypothetical protein
MKPIYLYIIISLLFISCAQEVKHSAISEFLTLRVDEAEYLDAVTFKSNEEGVVHNKVFLNDDYFLEVNIYSNSKPSFRSSHFREPLGNSVNFRILVFDENHKYLLSRDYVCGTTITTDIQLPANKHYSFIVYSFGTTSPIPPLTLNVGDDISVAQIALSSYEDVMAHSLLHQLIDQDNNILSFVLNHIFSKIKTTIDASNVGSINTVGNYSISNTYSHAIVKFTNQVANPLNLTFSSLSNNLPLSAFTVSSDFKTAISSEKLIFADGQQSQTLKLASLTIDNVQRTNLTLINHVFQPGVYYEVNVSLKRVGYVVGELYWAIGNLILENGVYKPASNQGEYGDYWLRADRNLSDSTAGYYYLTPINKNAPQVLGSGSKVKDICNQVGPGWRLPTYLEADTLEKFASWHNAPINRYVGYYTKPNKVDSVYGVYFGTNARPSYANQDKYLFIPFAGAYNSGVMYDFNSVGFYWHTGMDGGQGTSFQFALGYMSPRNNGGLDDRRANSVRCVRNK